MERVSKQQILEQSIYGGIWIVFFLLPLIGEYFALNGGLEKEEARMMVRDLWLTILPFFVLFLLNNYVLVPYLLFAKRYWLYTFSVTIAIVLLLWVSPPPAKGRFPKEFRRELLHNSIKENRRNQIIEMREKVREQETENEELPDRAKDRAGKLQRSEALPNPAPFRKPPAMIRYLIHFMIAFLMLGFNIAIKLVFKSFRDEERLKELEHQRLQSELQYLKYQINPHFFMNTLNNIHALVDIDMEKAKNTIVELSKLMRYVLYEASNKTVLLSREIQFLENYVTLMRLRYTDKVSIKMEFPVEVPGIQIPPLLFISFVENAFKHGVSYRNPSFISVVVKQEEDSGLIFRCTNSNHGAPGKQHHGIGLENVRKRLKLLYGNNYTLSITNDEHKFDVLLIIPLLS